MSSRIPVPRRNGQGPPPPRIPTQGDKESKTSPAKAEKPTRGQKSNSDAPPRPQVRKSVGGAMTEKKTQSYQDLKKSQEQLQTEKDRIAAELRAANKEKRTHMDTAAKVEREFQEHKEAKELEISELEARLQAATQRAEDVERDFSEKMETLKRESEDRLKDITEENVQKVEELTEKLNQTNTMNAQLQKKLEEMSVDPISMKPISLTPEFVQEERKVKQEFEKKVDELKSMMEQKKETLRQNLESTRKMREQMERDLENQPGDFQPPISQLRGVAMPAGGRAALSPLNVDFASPQRFPLKTEKTFAEASPQPSLQDAVNAAADEVDPLASPIAS
eukprot:GFYU01007210.1.p1 GENE.GFYU01007210.1~~GFYU01007210.1.p1  ORF type:complete len:335 (-),score=125.81 GFYU01007210.1:227-1231(-)